MSIAAISSSLVAAMRERAPVATVEASTALRGAEHAQRGGGRRHELVDAMKEVLGVEGEHDRSDEQAVFRFAHVLMRDLRSMATGSEQDDPQRHHEHGHGRAWGRRGWNDLPQRIDALATAAGASATPPVRETVEPVTPTPASTPTAPTTVPRSAPAPVSAASTAREVPPQPNPVTTTSAALHLMQVPSSRLLEAYAALRQALGDQTEAAASESARGDLPAFLERLSDALTPNSSSAVPTGSVLNLTA